MEQLHPAEQPPAPELAIATKSGRKRLFTNSVAMAAANLLGRGISYVYIILMARRLDTRHLGTYAILLTTNMLVELVSNLGLDKILVREIASNPADVGQGHFWTALPIRGGMALVSVTTAWCLIEAFYGHILLATPFACAMFLLSIVPVIASRNCEAFLNAHERLVPIAFSQLLERIVIFTAVLALVYGPLSFNGLLLFAPLAAFARLLTVAFAVATIWVPNTLLKYPPLRVLLRQGVELFSVEILALVYFRSDVFFIAKFCSLQDAGIYQIAYKIFDVCISLFTGFLQAAFPRMILDKSLASLNKMLISGTAILAVPVVIIIVSRRLILSTIRPEFTVASTSLIWLMLTVPLVYINTTLANMAIASNQIRLLIILASLLVVSNIGLNLYLIPRWSINGAAFSTFACELLSSVFLCPIIVWRLHRREGQS